MAKKTYIPQLVKILLLVCSYLRRYESQIKKALGPGSAAYITAILTACDGLRELAAIFLDDDTKYPTETN